MNGAKNHNKINRSPKTYDIRKRCFEFALKIIEFVSHLSKTLAGYDLGKQLLNSGTSVGANTEEADCAVSKRDFVNKVRIARKEAKESTYWLRLIKAAKLVDQRFCELQGWLINESTELVKISSGIMLSARKDK